MNIVPILFTFDDKLITPAVVCITSLLENAQKDTFYDIYIIHSEVFDFSKSKLVEISTHYDNCKINFRKVSGEFVGGYVIRGIPETCYYRLISPEIITEYDKIIYSDVDVIFREDLAYIYNTDIGDNHFAGVDNCSVFRPSVRNYLVNELHLDWRHGYYYSGNLVINLKQIREDKMVDKYRELGKNSYNQQDMDIMNIASNKRFYALTPAFCLTNYLYDLIVNQREKMETLFSADLLDHALSFGIIHYNGAKPWNARCMNQDIWWYYYRKSICYDEKFCYDFYDHQVYENERWTLWKRIKHVLRYFRK